MKTSQIPKKEEQENIDTELYEMLVKSFEDIKEGRVIRVR